MNVSVKELFFFERPALELHFLALSREDRRLRFGGGINDAAIRRYVNQIDFNRDAMFGVIDDDLKIIGAAHLARSDGFVEFGVSVVSTHRSCGIAGALLRRAHVHTRNWGVRKLFMHCLIENAEIMHLARKTEMTIDAESDEADAWLTLPLADCSSHMRALFDQRVALNDYALKCQRIGMRLAADNVAAAMSSFGLAQA